VEKKIREKSTSERWWLRSQQIKMFEEFFCKTLADKAHGRARVPCLDQASSAHACGVHPHSTTLLKPSPKEFNTPKKEGIIKIPQGTSHPTMLDNE